MFGELCWRITQVSVEAGDVDEQKYVLQPIWDEMKHDWMNKALLSFAKKFRACVVAGGGHFEHAA